MEKGVEQNCSYPLIDFYSRPTDPRAVGVDSGQPITWRLMASSTVELSDCP